MVQYNKVDASDKAVQQLAERLGMTTTQVAGMVNQDRYRKAYNKDKQERDKQMRAFFREHPEMLPKG